MFLLIFFPGIFFYIMPAYGHLYGYNFQEWKNQKDDILIQFETDPQTPVAGNASSLMFSVQSLETGKHLQNFTARITVLNASSSSAPAGVFVSKEGSGDFSQKYVFPNGGTYEVLLRVDTASLTDVSRFVVFVSSPSFQIANLVYLLLPIIVFLVLLGIALLFIVRYVYKKR